MTAMKKVKEWMHTARVSLLYKHASKIFTCDFDVDLNLSK